MFCISEKKLSEAATPFIVSVDVIYFLRINNALHYILLYNFWSEEAWILFFNLFTNLDNFEHHRSKYLKNWSFFMKNVIPLEQGNFIDLI